VNIQRELDAVLAKAESALGRYGNFASTHEALGVMVEEWDELRRAVHANNLVEVRNECIDLAAVCLRLAEACSTDKKLIDRSVK
jgi:hypothetical protein